MQPDSRTRTMAMLCHLLSLIGYFSLLGFVVGPLVLWMIKRHDDPFIDAHGRESVNFQITVLILFLIGIILIPLVVGLVILPLVTVYHLIFTIVASVRANDGVLYRYPLVIRFLK